MNRRLLGLSAIAVMASFAAYADLVSTDGSTVRFTSMNYADESGEDPMWSLAAVQDGHMTADGKGEIALVRNGEGGTIVAKLLPSTAYTHEIVASANATETTIEPDGTPAIKVSVTLYDRKGTELVHEEFSVIPENATIEHA